MVIYKAHCLANHLELCNKSGCPLKAQFWLLDVNREMVEGEAEVRRWGVDSQGNRIMIADRGFLPYLYLLPKRVEDVERLESVVEARCAKEVASVDVEEKLYFGAPLKAVKVTCRSPDSPRSA